ncbi:hypothetical protein HF888_15400 [Bermanella marisrubri]|uniref:MSHA biogenesis protein MshK n=1 Tax=Bermanella marisrubri TaxID=207949 RepID=Q1N2G0_9GAMM|nr:hypothetical protein [Bermanella marisrubri]EAT12447.1 hypothetical protein RED65_16456 [Oceanobacter sp. RED65] [Bermanella marisrubri]QIZ85526.1 hypothetical protein HF888_15400 [Bermanella marisrubri]
MKKWMMVFMVLIVPILAHGFDPMAPPNLGGKSMIKPKQTISGKKVWVLTQTIVNEQRRIAVVDGEVLQQGATYKGWLVADISAGSVVLTKQGRQKKLSITKPVSPVKTRRDPL